MYLLYFHLEIKLTFKKLTHVLKVTLVICVAGFYPMSTASYQPFQFLIQQDEKIMLFVSLFLPAMKCYIGGVQLQIMQDFRLRFLLQLAVLPELSEHTHSVAEVTGMSQGLALWTSGMIPPKVPKPDSCLEPVHFVALCTLPRRDEFLDRTTCSLVVSPNTSHNLGALGPVHFHHLLFLGLENLCKNCGSLFLLLFWLVLSFSAI